jgi:hypothetical protein
MLLKVREEVEGKNGDLAVGNERDLGYGCFVLSVEKSYLVSFKER